METASRGGDGQAGPGNGVIIPPQQETHIMACPLQEASIIETDRSGANNPDLHGSTVLVTVFRLWSDCLPRLCTRRSLNIKAADLIQQGSETGINPVPEKVGHEKISHNVIELW